MSFPVGRLRLDVLSDGEFRLDGGAMFGMVPRERWKTWAEPDEKNRVRLSTHTLLVRGDDFVLLIDPGLGLDLDRDLLGITKSGALEESLAEHGLAPADVTHVTYSHLHFDHTGGGDRFPNATHLVQEREWDAITAPSIMQSRSYRPDDRPPEDRVRFLSGDEEPLPGVAMRMTGGHSAGHQVILLEDEAIFWGDILPTSHHISPPRLMAYDLVPLTVIDTKTTLMREASHRGWLNFLYHDLDPAPRGIEEDGGRFRWAPHPLGNRA